MRYFCLLLLLVGISIGGLSQNLDSLARVVEAMPKDTLRIIQQLSLGAIYINNRSDNAAARPQYEAALALSEKLNFVRGIVESCRNLAYIHQSLGEYKTSIGYNRRTIILIEDGGALLDKKYFREQLVRTYSEMAMTYNFAADYPNGERNAYKSIELAQKYNTNSGFGCFALCTIFSNQKNYDEAKKYGLKALQAFEVANLTNSLARTNTALSLIATAQDQPQEALAYNLKAYELNKKINRVYGMRLSLYNISNNYFDLEDYEKATYYLNQSVKVMDIKDAKTRFETNALLLRIHTKSKNYGEAFRCGELALKFALESKQPQLVRSAYSRLYYSHITAQDSAGALIYLEKLNDLKDSLYSAEISKNSLELSKKYDTERKEQELAFLAQENKLNQEKLAKEILLAIALRGENSLKQDKLRQELLLRNALTRENQLQDEQIEQAEELQVSLQRQNTLERDKLTEQQQLNRALARENDLKQTNLTQEANISRLLMAGLALLLAFAGVFFMLFRKQQTDNKIIQQQSEDQQVLMREIHHRVKNNLQVISSMLRLQGRNIKDEQALAALNNSEARLQAIAMVHEKLYQSDNLSQVKLKDYLHDLLAIIQTQQNTTGAVEVQIDDQTNLATNLDTAVHVGLIINELVTNSYKYAFSKQPLGKLWLTLQHEHQNHVIILKDNGPGLTEGQFTASSKTLGMRLVNILTKQLNGNINYCHNGGAEFTLRFKNA